jgi:hypothetical protein
MANGSERTVAASCVETLTVPTIYGIAIHRTHLAVEITAMRENKKVAVQIYLGPEQEGILKALGKATGKSKAAIVRSCISKSLAEIAPESDPAMNIINLGSSGKGDVSDNHDDYL